MASEEGCTYRWETVMLLWPAMRFRERINASLAEPSQHSVPQGENYEVLWELERSPRFLGVGD